MGISDFLRPLTDFFYEFLNSPYALISAVAMLGIGFIWYSLFISFNYRLSKS